MDEVRIRDKREKAGGESITEQFRAQSYGIPITRGKKTMLQTIFVRVSGLASHSRCPRAALSSTY